MVLKLSDEVYAIYAHLQPASIRVKPGASVHRGQVLGLVGNSGLSFEPHLHFQISDGSLLLGAEGIPYIFESFEVLGHGREWEKGEMKTVPEIRKMQMPLRDEVVRFPSTAE